MPRWEIASSSRAGPTTTRAVRVRSWRCVGRRRPAVPRALVRRPRGADLSGLRRPRGRGGLTAQRAAAGRLPVHLALDPLGERGRDAVQAARAGPSRRPGGRPRSRSPGQALAERVRAVGRPVGPAAGRRGARRPASCADDRDAGGREHRLALGRARGPSSSASSGAGTVDDVADGFVSSLRYFQAMMSGRGSDSKPADRRSAATALGDVVGARRVAGRRPGSPAPGGTSARPRPARGASAGSITEIA